MPADLGGDAVASVASGGICMTPGSCRISGSEAEVWGLGIVQWIEPAAMQIYLGYRHFEADVSLVDANGARQAATGLKDFQVIKLGSIIAF